MLEVEYSMLSGEVINKERTVPSYMNYHEGDFVSQSRKKPVGMFRIAEIEGKKFILEQIDCDPIHWEGDLAGRGHGPDDQCKEKCRFFNECPISVHLMYSADLD